MSRRKYRFESRQAAEDAHGIIDRAHSILFCALNDIIRGDFIELKTPNFTLRLCRATSVSGGIACLTYHPQGVDQRAFTECDYLENKLVFWAGQTPNTDEQIELRDLYNTAKVYRDAALKEAS